MSQTPNGPAGPRINLRGAVDLSGLSRSGNRPGSAPSGPAGAGAGEGAGSAGVVVEVTESTFEGLVQQSTTYPVVFDLGAPSNEGSRELTGILERLAAEHAGAFLLAKVDAMTNPQFAQVFRVDAIPTVVAVVKGQPVPLFQGALPEEQVRQVIDQLLQVAAANGVTGRVPVADTDAEQPPAEEVEEELPPLHAEAYDAIERGDMDAAADAYRRAIAQNPGDDMAKAGLAQVELLRRTAGADLETARAAAAGNPTDVDAQLLVADLDVLGGHVEDAFVRLVDTVRATAGDERERVRVRLVELFEVVGGSDPRVVAARRALASALF